MHEILREEVFPEAATPVMAERLAVTTDIPLHGHGFIEMVMVLRGSATHVSSTGSHRVERGSVVVMRPGDWHGYTGGVDLSVINLYVGVDLFSNELAWINEDPRLGVVLRPSQRGRGSSATEQIRLEADALARLQGWCAALDMSRSAGATDRASRLGHLILVIGELAAAMALDTKRAPVPASTHPAVVRAVRLMTTDVREVWTLSRVARAVNLAPSYLVRGFSQQVGLPPMAYLNRLRAEQAAALLIETDLPVATIGAEVGWSDPSYASRRFRACFDLSPAHYRSAFRPGR